MRMHLLRTLPTSISARRSLWAVGGRVARTLGFDRHGGAAAGTLRGRRGRSVRQHLGAAVGRLDRHRHRGDAGGRLRAARLHLGHRARSAGRRGRDGRRPPTARGWRRRRGADGEPGQPAPGSRVARHWRLSASRRPVAHHGTPGRHHHRRRGGQRPGRRPDRRNLRAAGSDRRRARRGAGGPRSRRPRGGERRHLRREPDGTRPGEREREWQRKRVVRPAAAAGVGDRAACCRPRG